MGQKVYIIKPSDLENFTLTNDIVDFRLKKGAIVRTEYLQLDKKQKRFKHILKLN